MSLGWSVFERPAVDQNEIHWTAIAKADGPERIHGEWWPSDKETKLVRDYYRVETVDGTRYWLFRDGPAEQGGGRWLHGVGEA